MCSCLARLVFLLVCCLRPQPTLRGAAAHLFPLSPSFAPFFPLGPSSDSRVFTLRELPVFSQITLEAALFPSNTLFCQKLATPVYGSQVPSEPPDYPHNPYKCPLLNSSYVYTLSPLFPSPRLPTQAVRLLSSLCCITHHQ